MSTAVPEARTGSALRVLYGLWYGGIAASSLGNVVEPRVGFGIYAVYTLSVLGMCVAALGITIRTLWKPRARMFLQAMAAAGALVLCVATTDLRYDLGREAHASSLSTVLQPLAEELAGQSRIEKLGGWHVNEYSGTPRGGMYLTIAETVITESRPLDEILREEGISRAQYDRVNAALRFAGMDEVTVAAGHVHFRHTGPGMDLLYVRPGQPLAPPKALVRDVWRERSVPLGAGWYLLRGPDTGI